MKFYHVDTQGNLEENTTLQMLIHPNNKSVFQYSGANSAFTGGASPWGLAKLWNNLEDENAKPILILRDWIFELYRRDNEIQAPSRFQSLFVCETIEGAEELFNKQKPYDEEGEIYEVESDNAFGPFYYDWFSGNPIPAEMYWRAENYWNKVPFVPEDGEIGLTEYLIPYPCEIGKKVKTLKKDIEQEDAPNQSESN